MRLLDHADLRERKGIKYSGRHLRTLVAEHRFPTPLAMNGRIVWLESEIDEWVSKLPRRQIRRRRRDRGEAAESDPKLASVLRLFA
jgi:predicted DNA-binding transcriptional regulator AlpA